MTKPQLTGADLRTYEKLFQHPPSHNIEWQRVRKMLGKLGQVTEESNGHIVITRNGHTLALHRPHSKDISDMGELIEIRHFIERSEDPVAQVAPKGDVVVVISHHGARVFHSEMHGATAQAVKSPEPRYFQHVADSKDFSRGKEIPAPSGFFEPLAASLKDVRKILIFGCGTGKANEMEIFVTWLEKHRPELARRVVGALIVDEKQSSVNALLAKAREFYAQTP
jgi:hypothetical protein